MSTQINITIGDQRLLQASKERSAANRQALDGRTEASKNEAAASTALEQEQAAERQRNGVPEINLPRRPAAQRRKIENFFGFTGILFLRPRFLLDTEITDTQQVTDRFGKTRLNTYTLYTRTVEPYFEKIIKPNKVQNNTEYSRILYKGFTPYTRSYSVDELSWLVRYRTSISNIQQVAPFPNFLSQLNIVNSRKVLTSCTDSKVYYSIMLQVYETSSSIITGNNTNNAFFVGNSDANTFIITETNFSLNYTITPVLFTTQLQTPFTSVNSFYLGIYAECDVKTQTIQTRYVGLSTDYDFYNNLNLNDPHYSLFTAYISGVTPQSLAQSFARFYPSAEWPSSFSYNKKTGESLIIADPPQNYTGNLRTLMSYKFSPDLSYSYLKGFFQGLTSFTRTALLELGFTEITEFDIAATSTSLYSAVFPFKQ